MTRLVVVSNRVSIPEEGKPQAGGLAVAITGALSEHGGLWFGWDGRVKQVPSNRPNVVTRDNIDYATLSLSKQDYDNYYLGFANEVLWPVFHFNLGAMDFQLDHVKAYSRVNARFAEALVTLVQGDELIWVHDYHLLPLGKELRERGIRQPLGFFLHIPFPSFDLLRALPCYRELLEDLLHYDLVGFQTENDRHAFHEALVETFDATLKGDNVIDCLGHRLRTGVYPVGIDVDEAIAEAEHAITQAPACQFQADLGKRDLIIGADRLDYSKGLVQRFNAIETLLTHFKHRRQRTIFMQIASPSRSAIPEYDELRRQLEGMAGHINGTYADIDWLPVHYLNQTYAHADLMGLFRAARVGLVTPLRDGMNLVCKEFVAAQDPDDPGVLVLSDLAGAARELSGALLVNPYDVHDITSAIERALNMPRDERRQRYREMIDVLRRNSLLTWRQRFIDDLAQQAG
ncbi:alpha,alpha-trehalose-phosphate synthase (UDP-forming) [Chromohalobacter israelensis]|uniref:alpha,alpha-trehalose-phosphate synthase (UDP-forming) n=1 Tax=Chromohalobacter israelensis TaxID=141390 RepID=UPI001CC4E1B6|nr:trehalose-6-phosphate synthase [Chromohalobacter salexigens]MBZ5876295.1 trehalose-6-phosphate synthase [Chromohalobacter salexigens]